MEHLDIKKIKEKRTTLELLRFGIINIDKPTGPTSFSVTDYLRKNLDINKTSHMGTLDPQVTGVLPILLGRACRLSDYFMHKDKTYVGIMRLHDTVDEKKLKQVISKFIGKINQLPPVRSRVKRAIREREIKSFDILEINDKEVLFSTQVQAGTYIRKLIHDMGLEMGGAHMLELRRTQAGIFDENKINNLSDFDKAVEEYKKGNEKKLREMIVPAEIISTILPTVQVKKQFIRQLLTGKPLMKKDVSKIPDTDKFCIFCEDQFLGTYKKVDEGDIIARPEFVLN